MAEEKKSSHKISRSLFIILLNLCLFGVALAGTVIIKPGQFDHFTLQLPDRSVAGENFVIRASVYDSNNNLITNFAESGKDFRIDVTGSATVQPSVLTSSSFSGGIANVLVNNKKAEKIVFSIRESGGTVPVISKEIIISPNKLDHFNVQSPASVVAGAVFDLKVVAKDIFDNTIQDIDTGKNLKITTSGISSVRMASGGAIDFRNGTASVGFVSEKTGDLLIEIQDGVTGSKGKTGSITVAPAGLSYFKLLSPETAVAGEQFELVLAAYDSFNNLAANYSSAGAGIRLSSTGSSKVEPSSVASSEFRGGQAVVKVKYEKAEDIQIIAQEANREQSGRSQTIKISNSEPDHFVVVTPDTAVSGQTFKVKVEAYDRFNNIARNFNLVGNDVILGTSGNGTLAPSKITPTEFSGGIAVVDVMYDRAESFQISARMSSERTKGRMTVGKQDEHKVEHSIPVRSEKKQPEQPMKTAKTKEDQKQTKQQVVQKTQPVKEPARKEKPEPKKEEQKKPVQTKEVKPQEKLPPPTAKTDPVKEKPTVKIPAEEPKKVVAPPAKEEKKQEKSQLYTVSKVSIIEAKNKAMLVINVTNPNGHLEYGDEIESKYGKEWLKLKIKPAVNATDKSFRFKSSYIGEVLVEEDKTGGANLVNLYVELLPSGVTYDIARVKNTLVITLANP